MVCRLYGIAAFLQQLGLLYRIQWHFRQLPVERIGPEKVQMLLHVMLRAMVRAGNIEFSDSSQSLYFRSEETVSQILQVTLFIDGSFIRGGQVDGSFGSLEGNDGVYLLVLQAVRDKPVITFQDIGRLIPDL